MPISESAGVATATADYAFADLSGAALDSLPFTEAVTAVDPGVSSSPAGRRQFQRPWSPAGPGDSSAS